MTKRLVLLNLLLIAAIAAIAWQVRLRWQEARHKEEQLRARQLRPAPAPPVTPMAVPGPAQPASYLDVAQRMLFSKDRNPRVEEIVVAPPPPPVMPPLPAVKGVMLFGDVPTVIMAESAGAADKSYRPGDRVGAFKLLSVNDREIELEWDGKKVKRQLQEALLEAKKSQPAPAAAPAEAPAAAAPAAVTPVATALGGGKSSLGVKTSETMRACVAGDDAPAGTVVDGYKKIYSQTPMGRTCRWELEK